MKNLISELLKFYENGIKMSLASLIWSTGSIPMSDRAKMLILDDGSIIGTIGGGCLEAEVFDAARKVISTGKSIHLRYTMTEEQAGEDGLNCGGTVRIYIEPVDKDCYEKYKLIKGCIDRRETCLSLLSLNTEQKYLLTGDGEDLYGKVHNDIRSKIIEKISDGMFSDNQGEIIQICDNKKHKEVFIEPHLPDPQLFVFGGGHVGGNIAKLADKLNFSVVLVDDRESFANSVKHPYVSKFIVGPFDEIFRNIKIDKYGYIVAATRGHQFDEIVIDWALNTPAAYIGMLGSERKKIILWERLINKGHKKDNLDRVYSPIGINIGADTPEEISVSVMAEIIGVKRGSFKYWKTKNGSTEKL